MLHSIKLWLLFLLTNSVFSQNYIRITDTKFGSIKTYELFCNENLEYKLKGDIKYKFGKIVIIQDSFIVLKDTILIKISEIKSIKINKKNRIVSIISNVLITAGLGFSIIDSGNNLITNQHPYINSRSIIITIPFVVSGLLIKQINIKRIRINKQKVIKVLTLNYNLNCK